MEPAIVGLAYVSVLSICITQLYALKRGINGRVLSGSAAILGGVVGLCFGLGL